MLTTDSQLDRLDISLRILDGLTKAFENLDKLFDELVEAEGENLTREDAKRYDSHCRLLENLHSIVVQDLTALRNDLVCECDDDESDLLVEHNDDDFYPPHLPPHSPA